MNDEMLSAAASGREASNEEKLVRAGGPAGSLGEQTERPASRAVMVDIAGQQWQLDEEPTVTRYTTEGRFYQKNVDSVIVYRQSDQNGFGNTNAVLTLKEDSVTLVWNGDQHIKMIFAVGRREVSNLSTPEGVLSLGIFTSSVEVTRLPHGGEVHIRYALDTPGAPALNTRLDIDYHFV